MESMAVLPESSAQETVDLILQLAEFSELVYDEWANVTERLQEQGIPRLNVKYFDADNGSQAMLVFKDGYLYLVFRGTETPDDWKEFLKDWKTNSKIRKRQLRLDNVELLRCHRGFWNGYRVLFNALNTWLKFYQGTSLVIGGHSLGGALASLAALHIESLNSAPIRLVATFGQPRVFNKWPKGLSGQAILNQPLKSFRFVCDRDIVPHVPSWWIGFRHWGNSLCLTRTHLKLQLNPFIWGLQYVLEYLTAVVRSGAQVAENHATALYIYRIRLNSEQLKTYIEGASHEAPNA